MELILIKPNTEAFEFMWEWLANHPINEGLTEPKIAENQGQSWEYMGTFRNNDKFITEFRHKCHPTTNALYKAIVEHPNVTENQIEKSAKIK